MSLVDIAVNLTAPAFDRDRDGVVSRATAAGVGTLVVTGSSLDDSAAAVALAGVYDCCVATVGVHPHNAAGWDSVSSPGRLRDLAGGSGKIVAIGECGLDYNRDFSPRDAQRECFRDQLALAAELGMPVFLHEREAFGDFLPILETYRTGLPGAVVHCFTGGERELAAYLALDCHIGITGWVCDERRGGHLIPLVRRIPADRLLLETDAPYLIPRNMPKTLRGKSGRNEPAFLTHVAAFVAGITGKSPERVAEETGANAARLFGLPARV